MEISQLGHLAAPRIRRRSWYKIWQWRSKPAVDSLVEPNNHHRYICLTGRVEPIDRSRLLKSTDSQSTGVIHKVVTKEVVTVKNGSRFWYETGIISRYFKQQDTFEFHFFLGLMKREL